MANVALARSDRHQLAMSAEDAEPPRIEHRPPQSAPAEQPLEIEAIIRDPSGVFEPTVYYRAAGARRYSAVVLTPQGGDRYQASIAPPRGTPAIEYFLEAFDGRGNGPALHGKPDDPHRVQLVPRAAPGEAAPAPAVELVSGEPTGGVEINFEEERGPPWRKRGPWAYVTLGVGGAAAIAGVVFGLRARSTGAEWATATNRAAWSNAKERAQSAATQATVAWVAAGVLTAAGGGLFFFTRF